MQPAGRSVRTDKLAAERAGRSHSSDAGAFQGGQSERRVGVFHHRAKRNIARADRGEVAQDRIRWVYGPHHAAVRSSTPISSGLQLALTREYLNTASSN